MVEAVIGARSPDGASPDLGMQGTRARAGKLHVEEPDTGSVDVGMQGTRARAGKLHLTSSVRAA